MIDTRQNEEETRLNQDQQQQPQQQQRHHPQPNKPIITVLINVSIVVLLTFFFFEMRLTVPYLKLSQIELQYLLEQFNQTTSAFQKNVTLFSHSQKSIPEQATLIAWLTKNISQLYHKAIGTTQELPLAIQHQKTLSTLEERVHKRKIHLDLLQANNKELIRSQRNQLFEKLGNTTQFRPQKIRNPWNLTRLNLNSPYMDTVEKKLLVLWMKNESLRLSKAYPTPLQLPEQHICVIVITRNNAQNYRYEYNIQSILNQQYSNYSLIIVDDGSKDGTSDLITSFMTQSNRTTDSYLLIRNQKSKSTLENLHNTITQHCNKDDIAVLVQGSDQLVGTKVFQLLNLKYQEKQAGVIYANYFNGHPKTQLYLPKQISMAKGHQNIRKTEKEYGSFISFKVNLFNQISIQHLKYPNGNWIEDQYDEAYIVPLIEMACNKAQHLDEFVYLSNYGNDQHPSEVENRLESEAIKYIYGLPSYKCLQQTHSNKI